jgi:hypothetical protein
VGIPDRPVLVQLPAVVPAPPVATDGVAVSALAAGLASCLLLIVPFPVSWLEGDRRRRGVPAWPVYRAVLAALGFGLLAVLGVLATLAAGTALALLIAQALS